jgi:hypothetical protein
VRDGRYRVANQESSGTAEIVWVIGKGDSYDPFMLSTNWTVSTSRTIGLLSDSVQLRAQQVESTT